MDFLNVNNKQACNHLLKVRPKSHTYDFWCTLRTEHFAHLSAHLVSMRKCCAKWNTTLLEK